MPKPKFAHLLVTFCLSAGAFAPAWAAEPIRVVVTIKPIHSLVAGVMERVGQPSLLITGGGSPHSYSLKPSEAKALRQANVVVRVSEHLETFLDKPIQTLAKDAHVVTTDEFEGMTLLEPREGGIWEEHEHEEPEHEAHKDGKADHDHDKAEAAGHDHEHEGHDAHLWLTPENARVVVEGVAKVLAEADPDNAARYQANAEKMKERLAALDAELMSATKPLAGKPFIVFHDAYHYFEQRYGLSAAGSITVSPERQPGAKRLNEIRKKVQAQGATCVFAEPQFEPKLINTIIKGTNAKSGVLDPLGAALQPGPDLYFELMRGLATSLSACLLR